MPGAMGDGRLPTWRRIGGLVFGVVARLLVFGGTFVVLSTVAAVAASPFGRGSPAVQLAVQGGVTLAAALGAGWATLAWLDGGRPGDLGFAVSARTPREIGRGVLVGMLMMAAVVVLLVVAGALRYRPEAGGPYGLLAAWLGGAALLALPAASEEALFRGYPFQLLVRTTGPIPALVLTSAAFAGAHLWNPDVGPFALTNIFLAGIVLGSAYLRTGSLWAATGLHLAWNWTMGSVAELPVSGLTLLHTPLYDAVERGPHWLTGGGFGPEGGLVGAVGFLAGMALLSLLPRAAAAVPKWWPGGRAHGPGPVNERDAGTIRMEDG